MTTLKQYLQNEYSKTSINGYENMINRFLLASGSKAATAGYTDILDYIGLLREQNLHPKSLRNNLFAIKIYYRFLVATGKRKDHPCQYLNLKDQINRAIPVETLYAKEILEELYESWQSKNPVHQTRNKIIISLLVYQALTVLEITQIKVSNINLEAGTVYVKANVKNKERTLNLKPKQILLFHNYLKDEYKTWQRKQKPSKRQEYFLLTDEGLQLRPSAINKMINYKREPPDKLIPLKIRQSVIAHLLKENNDIRIVQEFAGHRRAASTEAYKQTGLEELKSAIEKLHPLQ
ncbi:MAG: tyrosine-type recombinase/integrase [Chitinophagaceae bacterium]|nr:tyrosine-type recombinase/integrase [Chitinophagaceae bacterium]